MSSPEPEIVKWYTNARRFPQLIGKTPDGAKIWGGPYTYTQVFVGVGLLLIGLKTTWLWGHFGTVGNMMALLGFAYGATLAVGKLPLGSRNPLAVAAGVYSALAASPTGTYGGRKVALRRPHRVESRVQVEATVAAPNREISPAVAPASQPAPAGRLRRLPALRWGRVASSTLTRDPAPQPPSPSPPVLTGVQMLLASSTQQPNADRPDRVEVP